KKADALPVVPRGVVAAARVNRVFMRFRSLFGIICLPFLLGVADGSGQVPTPAQQRCIVALNRAGAEVAAAAARNVATCITQAALVGAKSSRRGTACQQSAARSMGDITQTILREFNDCKAAGLRAGTVRSAEDLGTCWGVDRGGTVARTIGKARGLVTRKCATTPILIAFPGACANEALGTLVDCLVSQLQCALCV